MHRFAAWVKAKNRKCKAGPLSIFIEAAGTISENMDGLDPITPSSDAVTKELLRNRE